MSIAKVLISLTSSLSLQKDKAPGVARVSYTPRSISKKPYIQVNLLITTCTVKGSQVRKLKASGNQAPDAVWEEALRNKLLLQKPVKENAEELEELEFVSTINKDGHMSLILRRNIGELTVSV
jgi:hypothetical protein